MKLPIYLMAASSLLTVACNQVAPKSAESTEISSEKSASFNNWLNQKYEEKLRFSPETLTQMGRDEMKDQLNDVSETAALKQLEWKKKVLKEMDAFNPAEFDEQTAISYQLFKGEMEEAIQYEEFRHYDYPINQMFGEQSTFPSFMINAHAIKTQKDASAYISRLNALPKRFDDVIDNLKLRADKGIIIPKFVFAHAQNDCKNVIGNPGDYFENILYKDFISKVEKVEEIKITEDLQKSVLSAITNSVIPAYQKLSNYLTELEKKATTDDGVWKFPNGDKFYQYRLKTITTTDMTAEEIFATGEKEVARIHGEMKKIMKQVNFEGDLQAFFKHLRDGKQFFKEDSDAGRAEMLTEYNNIIDAMRARLDDIFYTKPKADLVVKQVEAFREKSAGLAFYEVGSVDGTRPGVFYTNLYKMEDNPVYQMEALAYHEALPGHHMQLSIAQEMDGIAEFRKFKLYIAYLEGWGLYCEYLPKEMGFYTDPYSDFGRLSMELWRACRLVVDAGIHHKKWTREQAIKYLQDNTPSAESTCKKAIERYIVMPGQATAYKIGMMKILEVREHAKKELGDQFDIKKFHDIFLLSGAVPLDVFEERVNNWINEVKGNQA